MLSAHGLLAGEDEGSSQPETTDEGAERTPAATAPRASRIAQEASVQITATRKVGMMQETSYGSGVVIKPDGYVVTAHHVIRDADTIQLITAENEHLDARSVRVDHDHDLALLKADFSLPSVTAPLAEDGRIGLGKKALVVGISESTACPHTLAARIGERRTVVWDGRRALLTSVEVDVPCGFSGCGCFDAANGRLLGVIVAKSTCHRCNGYLVPAHRIAEILSQRESEPRT